MKNKTGMSLWKKVNLLIICSGIFILGVTSIMWRNVDRNAKKLDGVYGSNVSLVELQQKLDNVQNCMEEYLDSKTSETMESYYSASDEFQVIINDLESKTSGSESRLMEKNIKHLSESYLELTVETVEAKRARNVEGYKEKFEESEKVYQYIKTYIYSLNNEQFRNNSAKYGAMVDAFHYSEVISMMIMIILIALVLGTVSFAVSRMTALEESKEKLKIENMVKEKEHEMESSIKDAKLKYLQAQIHPHFLFNSLNAGAQLSMLEGASRSYDYIQNLADFFRYNLKKQDEVTLEEELAQIDHYIYILNVRFAGEIGFSKQIDESLIDQKMPAMILQPIVENSVNYGIRNITREKKIELEVSRVDDMVCICIRDNGVGISEEKIRQIMQGEPIASDESNSNGVGMSNVMNRLQLYYNVEEVVMINNLGEDVGTEVMLYLPYNGEGINA